jgi:hypothetical protein
MRRVDGRSSRRQEQVELAAALRARGLEWAEIAATLRDRYNVNGRVALRLAHGWGQGDAAAAWNEKWPDEPKTFKNFSYWEKWPSRTGYTPSLAVLDRLAELYECDVADLLAGWGEHRTVPDQRPANNGAPEPAVLAWQVEHLPQDGLVRALREWARRLPAAGRRSLLLKLSMAAAVAANESESVAETAVIGAAPSLDELVGLWDSSYSFYSTGRNAEFHHSHQIGLRAEHGKLIGRSVSTHTGTIELELTTDGLLITGSWAEYTSPTGYYRGAVYHGILQLVLDPTGRTMAGQWLGPDKHFVINAGPWTLTRSATPSPAAN